MKVSTLMNKLEDMGVDDEVVVIIEEMNEYYEIATVDVAGPSEKRVVTIFIQVAAPDEPDGALA